jgi:hypothetical protein
MSIGLDKLVIKKNLQLFVKQFTMTVSKELLIGAFPPSVYGCKIFEFVG